MTTIKDVAERAGVAAMTVSRVINDSGYVSEKTRAKVQAAIDELGYVPNMLGQSLRSNQTNTVALVLTDISNPFWTTVARGVEDAAQAEGYSVILCNTDESLEKQNRYLDMLLKRRIDGILLVPSSSSAEAVTQIKKVGISVVVLDRSVPTVDVDIVRGNSVEGARKLTEYLLSLGHTRIAMLAGPEDVSTSANRVQGFRDAMAAANLADPPVYWGTFSRESGEQMAREALALEPRPSALFGANNYIALGALHATRELGYHCPDDVSIVSFGDIPAVVNPSPFFTVATHGTYEMGQEAMKLLLRRINGATDPYQHVLLSAEIAVRHSTAPYQP